MDMQPGAPADFLKRPLLRAMADALAEFPAAARQDGLDFLAVIAGMKRVCLIGRGMTEASVFASLHRLAAQAGLPIHLGGGWEPLGDLPDWYRAASAKRSERQEFLYICADETARREAAALCAKGRVTAGEEAVLLSYPPCCVAAHHRRILEIERLYAAWAGTDVARAARLIEAGIEPRPPSPAEWARLEALCAIAPAPYTSVNMCAACAAGGKSAVASLSRRYRALALSVGWA